MIRASITRYPSLKPQMPAKRGSLLLLEVDLLRGSEPDQPEAFTISELPADWTELPVRVLMASPHITFFKNEGTILVQRNADSVPCSFAGIVSEKQPVNNCIEAVADFYVKDRFCVSARCVLPIEEGGAEPDEDTESRDQEHSDHLSTGPSISVSLKPTPPDLTVRIKTFSASDEQFWLLQAPRLRELKLKLEGQSKIADTQSFVAELFDVLPDMSDPKPVLEGIGRDIYDKAPECFKVAYWRLRESLGCDFSIQFVVDEAIIPWEFMRPYREDGDDLEAAEILALAHPVGRWLSQHDRDMPWCVTARKIARIAPRYGLFKDDKLEKLPSDEGNWSFLKSGTGVFRVDADRKKVLGLLARGKSADVGILYFYGHGEFNGASADFSKLFLEYGEFLLPTEVGRVETRLGIGCGTLAFINACEIGAGGAVLGGVGGWAKAFLKVRFGGFIAPLWAVDANDALAFTREALRRVLNDGWKIGAALTEARKKALSAGPSGVAYVYYGDVNAAFNLPAVEKRDV